MQVHFFIVQPFMTPVQSFSQTKNFGELHRQALGGAMFSGELARATGSCLHDDPPELALRHRCSKCRLQPTSAILKKHSYFGINYCFSLVFWRVRITFLTMLTTSESYKKQLPETSCIFFLDLLNEM